jgi:hypothetical protein
VKLETAPNTLKLPTGEEVKPDLAEISLYACALTRASLGREPSPVH